jgi:fibro-slime domain-containing protein
VNFKIIGIAALATFGLAQAATISLTGTLRDFKGISQGGHADFDGWCCGDDHGIVTGTLGPDGKPVYAGGSVSTHGATAFNQWFNDAPGVNLSHDYAITLDNTGHPDVYSYSSNSFFPLDGVVGPNGEVDAGGHNFSFTYELNTNFAYQSGQNFTFTGDDDVFVYINNALVIDLGGVHGPESRTVNLDLLGLTAGNNYTMNVFFAERHQSGSNFRIDTNIESIVTQPAVPEPTSMALFGFGMAGLAMAYRRRKN